MSEAKEPQEPIVYSGQTIIVRGGTPILSGTLSADRVPLEWVKKYSSPKPVRRSPPRPRRTKQTEEESQ